MWDERERKDSEEAVAGNYEQLAPRIKPKREEIGVISVEKELGEFHLSCYETVDDEGGYSSGLEQLEEDSF